MKLALDALSQILTHYFKLDQNHQQNFALLANKIIALELTDLNKILYFQFTTDAVMVSDQAAMADATIKTTLINLVKTAHTQKIVAGQGVALSGDLTLIKNFQQLLVKADIDWQYHLAKYIGDTPAYLIGRGLAYLGNARTRIQKQFKNNLKAFLVDEQPVLVPRLAIESYCQQIGELRMASERLAARINQLRKQEPCN